MSSGSQEKRVELLTWLARELRQFHGFGASFFRAAAGRVGMTVTDLQVIDILDSTGPATAGQLADLTGLTTGAITGMINRLEEAGLVLRERDPNDGRRVIVRLTTDQDKLGEINSVFHALEVAWDDMASSYSDGQLALFGEFLKQSNASAQRELVRLRESPPSEGGIFSAPLGDLTSGRLLISGAVRLVVRAGEGMTELYQARFEGAMPDVKVKDGGVNIRYPRRLLGMVGGKREAEVTLSNALSWQIVSEGGASEVIGDLGGLALAGIEVKGGFSLVRLELPKPTGVVPLKISGAASTITVHRPAGVAARIHLKGWVSVFVFDEQRFNNMGNDTRMQSTDFDASAPYYDIEVVSSASTFTITAG